MSDSSICETIERNLSVIPLFGPSKLGTVMILLCDLALTFVHTGQEWKGRLWRYFGAIAGIQLDDWTGFWLFFAGLTAALWAIALAGIAGYLPVYGPVPAKFRVVALGGLIGGRLADTIYSHLRLHWKGYRPNLGLTSALVCFGEALVLLAIFSPGIHTHYTGATLGFAIGWLLFQSILWILKLLRRIAPSLRRQPWEPGQKFSFVGAIAARTGLKETT